MDHRAALAPPREVSDTTGSWGLVPTLAGLAAGSVGMGAATSWAQGVLPAAVASLGNSPSGWVAATALVVAATRSSPARGAILGVVGFVGLVVGYTVASRLRGLHYDPVFWSVVGVLAGPFVGASAAALAGTRPYVPALGSGLLAGVLIGDGIYGLTVVSDTTSPTYWIGCVVVGSLLIVVSAVTRIRTVPAVTLQVATLAATTAAMTLGYAMLNSLP